MSMSNWEVAKAFAERKTKGRSGTMFISTELDAQNEEILCIWSYGKHFLLAKWALPGENKVWLTTRKYSHTTSCHRRIVRDALERVGAQIVEAEL